MSTSLSTSLFLRYIYIISLIVFLIPLGASAQDITTGLVGHWKFDEGAGTTAGDSSGNNNTGILTNGPTWTTGKIGGAVNIGGGSQQVTVPDTASLDVTGTLTVSLWIKPTTLPTGNAGFLSKAAGGDRAYSLNGNLSSSSKQPQFWISRDGDSSTKNTVTGTNILTTNTWYHVVGVFQPSVSAQLYMNAAVNAQITTGIYASIHNSAAPLRIGFNSDTSESFNGAIDDVRVYNRALTASEVQTIYNLGSGTPPPSDTTPPTVSMTAPASGSTVLGSSVTVSANASDNVGVVGVQFKLDGVNLGSEDTSSPYSITWNSTTASNGSHTLTAVARDAAGNQTISSGVSVTVNNTAPPIDTQAPSIPTGFTATAISSSQINLSWTASTDNMGVTGYRVYRGGSQITTVTGTSYSDTGLSPSTSYSYTVAAYDAAGNVSGQSTPASATTQASSGGGIPSTLGWYSVPNTRLRSVCPPNGFGGSGYAFTDYCHGVTDSWSGGTVDTLRNRLIMWGGGHASYQGNDLYAFDLDDLTLTRLTDPGLPLANVWCDDTVAGGIQPNARHTYGGFVYMANVDRLFEISGTEYCPGGIGTSGRQVWTYNFSGTGPGTKWQKMDPTIIGTPPIGNLDGKMAAYDPMSGQVFFHDRVNLYSYNFTSNTITQRSNGGPIGSGWNESAVVDPNRKLLIVIGGGGVYSYDISGATGYTGTQRSTTGATGIVGAAAPGLAYDSVNQRVVAWDGGNTIYFLDTGTWQWTSQSFSGGPAAMSNGTYGRFGYVPNLNLFVTYNSVDANGNTLRLSSGGADTTPPTVSLTAPTSGSTVSGSSVTVSATASDNVGVSGVQFLLDGANLGTEDTTSPYSVIWNTTTATNGSHTLTARARDAAGNQTTSSAITVTVSNTLDTTAPTAPANLTATAVSSSQINLSWTASTDNVGVTGYRVERCQGSTCTNFAQVGTPASNSFNDTGLTANTTYRYQVRAVDAANNLSPYSNITNATTQSGGGTSADADFQARCSAPGVIKCVSFDNPSDFVQGTTIFPGDVGYQYLRDTTTYSSGGASLRFTVPSLSSSDASGTFRALFGQSFGQGQTFYVQFRQRFSPEYLQPFAGTNGWKQFIMWHSAGGGSCTDVQLVSTMYYWSGFPIMYTACGGRGASIIDADGDVEFNFGSPTGGAGIGGYWVTNRRDNPGENDPALFLPNAWQTFTYQVTIGNWNTPNTTLKAWLQNTPGQANRLWVNMNNFQIDNDAPASKKFEKIDLMTYMTGKNGSVSQPIAYTWYDELIVSTQPIAAPGTTPPPTPLLGDLNSDGTVNALDWGIMASVWFTNDAIADINGDGIVNSIDFSLMNANWGRNN